VTGNTGTGYGFLELVAGGETGEFNA